MDITKIVISDLVNELHQWHLRNYPTGTDAHDLLAIGEEFGELQRVEVKQSGNIRGTWEYWQAEKKKEIGDVLIGLAEFCARVGRIATFTEIFRDLKALPAYRLPTNVPGNPSKSELILLLLGKHLGSLSDQFLYAANIHPGVIDTIVILCRDYCVENTLDIETCFVDRWTTISQRDFITNPETGGREKEDIQIADLPPRTHFISAILTGESDAKV
jgi:hypothetical protein